MGHRVGVEGQRAKNEVLQAPNPPYPVHRPLTSCEDTVTHCATLAPVTECLLQMAYSAPCHPVPHGARTQLYPLGLLWTPWYDP